MSGPDPSPSQPDGSEGPKPKLVVDSDWKEQVEQEKRQALEKEQQAAADQPAAGETANESVPGDVAADATATTTSADQSAQGLPPAGMEYLLSMLMSQAMAYMGAVPELAGEDFEVNKPLAKHAIDTLEVLEEKTKGNLTEHESKMMGEVLHVLRMTYVNTR